MSLDVLDTFLHPPSANYPVMDPVCGMGVRPREAPAHSDVSGMRYYFCSYACRREFEQNVWQYLDEDEAE